MLFLMAVQAVQLPDIELHATIAARSVTIEKQGDVKLEVTASPDAGSIVKVEAPKANGRKTLRDVRVNVDVEARIGGEVSAAATADTVPR